MPQATQEATTKETFFAREASVAKERRGIKEKQEKEHVLEAFPMKAPWSRSLGLRSLSSWSLPCPLWTTCWSAQSVCWQSTTRAYRPCRPSGGVGGAGGHRQEGPRHPVSLGCRGGPRRKGGSRRSGGQPQHLSGRNGWGPHCQVDHRYPGKSVLQHHVIPLCASKVLKNMAKKRTNSCSGETYPYVLHRHVCYTWPLFE